jgi:hypothetical protein
MGNEADAAGIVLVSRIVQTLNFGWCAFCHLRSSPLGLPPRNRRFNNPEINRPQPQRPAIQPG